MLTEKQKRELVSLNKKQARLVERFEALGKQLDKAGVAILVDEENNDVYYANTKHLKDGKISSFHNIMENNPDEQPENIEEIGYLPTADLPLSLTYTGRFYAIFRKGT